MLHAETSGTEPESERPVLWMHTELWRWWFQKKFCRAKSKRLRARGGFSASPSEKARNRYNQEFDPYAGHPPWAHHRKHRAGEGQDDRRHGDRPPRRRPGHAGPDAAIPQRIVALRRTRCGAGLRRQVRDEADGARLREGRHGKT